MRTTIGECHRMSGLVAEQHHGLVKNCPGKQRAAELARPAGRIPDVANECHVTDLLLGPFHLEHSFTVSEMVKSIFQMMCIRRTDASRRQAIAYSLCKQTEHCPSRG